MKIKNIFNLGILVVLGFGSLSAYTSKSSPLPELSQPLDLSSCTNSTYPDQQYELVKLKASISSEVQYSKSSSLISVNKGELLIPCLDRSEALNQETYTLQWAGFRRSATRAFPSRRTVPSNLWEASKHKYQTGFREFNKSRKSPASSQFDRILHGPDGPRKISAFSSQYRERSVLLDQTTIDI